MSFILTTTAPGWLPIVSPVIAPVITNVISSPPVQQLIDQAKGTAIEHTLKGANSIISNAIERRSDREYEIKCLKRERDYHLNANTYSDPDVKERFNIVKQKIKNKKSERLLRIL